MRAFLPPLACQVAVPNLERVLRQRGADTCSWKPALGGPKSAPSCNYGHLYTCPSLCRTVRSEGRSSNSSSCLAASGTCYASAFVP